MRTIQTPSVRFLERVNFNRSIDLNDSESESLRTCGGAHGTRLPPTFHLVERLLIPNFLVKLMHHWTLITSLTFPLSMDPSVKDINTNIMPTLGLTNEAMLYCLFFLTALHMIKTEKYTTEAAEAYQTYLDLSIRHHRVDGSYYLVSLFLLRWSRERSKYGSFERFKPLTF